METYSIIGSISTVVSFLVFVGILLWAYSGRRREAFAEAANAPFALPDEGEALADGRPRGAAAPTAGEGAARGAARAGGAAR